VGPDDGKVAELLRKGYWTLPDLRDASGLPPQPVHALVYSLYITNGLDVKNAGDVPRLRKRSETPLPPNAQAASAATVQQLRDPSGSFKLPQPSPGANVDGSGAFKMPSGANPLPTSPSGSYPRAPTPASGSFKLPQPNTPSSSAKVNM